MENVFYCLIIVNYCIEQKTLYVNYLCLLWAMTYIVLDNQKALKNTFQATTFKDEENSSTFQGLAQKFKDFSRKNGIQGLFSDFP